MPFQPGNNLNPKGRPRKPEVELVRKAIESVGEKKKKTLWLHLIEQCYEDNAVLIAVAKKFVPDKIEAEVTEKVDLEPLRKEVIDFLKGLK